MSRPALRSISLFSLTCRPFLFCLFYAHPPSNILKDLNHEHIVRYIDRHVDRDAGILYILMEYCGGGDLSTVIKQAAKHNRPIPEDTIWSYFMQILLALHQCHHPNGHARSSSSGGSAVTDGAPCDGNAGGGRRVQILHRDLKPDNGAASILFLLSCELTLNGR